MSIKNGIKENIKLAATITSEASKYSPVVMGGNPTESIKKISQLGYDAVELHWGNPDQIDIDKIISACEKYDIMISAFATGRAYVQEGLSLIDDDEVKRKSAIRRVFEFVDMASPFGATILIGCLRGNIKDQGMLGYYCDKLAESTLMVADYAAGKGVPIVFEAINRYENNYLNTAAETLDFIKRYNLPNTKILLDTFHMNIEDSDMVQAILSCGSMVGYVHFADSNRHYVGGGHLDFKEIISALKAINYRGFISAECLPLPDSDTALIKWIQGVKNVF